MAPAQEREVRRHVKAVGGKWNPRQVVWELPYGHVAALGLTARIVTKTEGKEERMDHLHIESMEKESPSTYR